MNQTVEIIVGGDTQFDYQSRVKTVECDLTKFDKLLDVGLTCINVILVKGFNLFYTPRRMHFPKIGIRSCYISHGMNFPKHKFIFIYKEQNKKKDLNFKSDEEKINHPFKNLKSLLLKTDLNFFNLECPLSRQNVYWGVLCADPLFVKSLSQSNIRLVSVANNHSYDLGEPAFLDTLKNLEKENINFIGGGVNLNEARKPYIFKKDDTKIAFLAYFQNESYGIDKMHEVTPTKNKPGILPICEDLIYDDILNVKDAVDLVFVSLHWGNENTPKIHPLSIKLAHKIIDSGADCILGHHPHVPKGIEIYKNKPIFYSFGNFVFGYSRTYWGDNFIARINIKNKKIYKTEIIPISGKNEESFQPRILTGERFEKIISFLQKNSINTKIVATNGKGVITHEHFK